MAISFSNIGGAEPSTLTFKAGTVVINRGSTAEQQEIICLGDPQTSNAIARVLAAAPTSTEFGLLVRIVSGPSSAADLPVLISGNSTVVQGTNPWIVGGNSSIRANLSSTAADNPVSISGNSTVFQGTSPWVIGGNSSVRANFSSTSTDNPVTAASVAVASATLSNVNASGSAVTVLASNASRNGAIVYNDSTTNLRIKFGTAASATSFTYFLGPGATWEMPPAITYTGIITGIWDSATGAARVTEL